MFSIKKRISEANDYIPVINKSDLIRKFQREQQQQQQQMWHGITRRSRRRKRTRKKKPNEIEC